MGLSAEALDKYAQRMERYAQKQMVSDPLAWLAAQPKVMTFEQIMALKKGDRVLEKTLGGYNEVLLLSDVKVEMMTDNVKKVSFPGHAHFEDEHECLGDHEYMCRSDSMLYCELHSFV